MWSFVVPAAWLAFFATPDQLARLSAPANALLMTLFLVHYLNRCVMHWSHGYLQCDLGDWQEPNMPSFPPSAERPAIL